MKFIKKPVVIEAIQFVGDDLSPFIKAWGSDFCRAVTGQNTGSTLTLFTLEGDHTASMGDWIIRGVKGEFYPCKPDIFEMTYEPAEKDV